MKSIKIENSRGVSLNSDYYKGSGKKMVILCHGFFNNKSSDKKFDMLGEKLNGEGYGVIKFDFSGEGDNEKEPISVDKEVEDLKDVIEFAKDEGYREFFLVGHSLGGLVCLRSCSTDIKGMVLWAPVSDKLDVRRVFQGENLPGSNSLEEAYKELEKNGFIEYKEGDKSVLLSKELIEGLGYIDQKELLKNIECPVFIIHGKQDSTIPVSYSENLMELLKEGELEITDCGHKMNECKEKIVEMSFDWINKKF